MSLRASAFAVGIAIIGTVFACADSVKLGYGTTDDAVSFTRADGGDQGTASDASADSEAGMCVRTACPAPWETCAGAGGELPTYACGTNLEDDTQNCGSCGTVCREPSSAYNVHMGCTAGQCQAFCNPGHSDCNGIPDDGCEASILDDPANCGACGVTCAEGVACIKGKCGCPAGFANCDGICRDLANDNNNCGACNFGCGDHQPDDAGTLPDHMAYACSEGQCKALRCVQGPDAFWQDCNADLDKDGCEVDLRNDNANCGACGNACAPGKQCANLNGTIGCYCDDGQTLCPATSRSQPTCADTDSDPNNCGACGYFCPNGPNSRGVCVHGRCRTECVPGTADCNGREDDGCEVDLSKDPRNCGACGSMCDVAQGQPCVGGFCLTGECEGPVTK
ncbi:Tryptophan synthase alpha chain [Labilithrix luteola]|uniref:Tryptophan synthase alpha chain n=1 Tax=Labilithrix luteola TaxID=1391654 RepID=A0A0K1Q169_9BACT|nr:hypothetical protein [Labilithrix luteola]AKU99482.1 Tryptophan synthase alpha chain [Labilithrix luteola]